MIPGTFSCAAAALIVRLFLRALVLGTALALAALPGGGAPTTPRPNVILIMTDDQGYGDLGWTGNPVVRTPAIDRLARESVRMTDYHASPTCSPTRAALLTGRYANRVGVWHTILGRSMLRETEQTLGDLFAAGGYRTGLFGKWHLGDNSPYRPEERGFREVVCHGGGGVGQTPDHWDNAYFDDTYLHNGKPRKFSGYCTDVFFQEAQRFITESARAGQPFFVYLAPNAPHVPLHVAEPYRTAYASRGLTPQEETFFGMISNLDENVGRLREWLTRQGLSDSTILIFTTDNGTAGGRRVFNAGMRGQKGSEYEGGHRVPFFLHWPAGGLAAGRDVGELTSHIDVAPTLLELCGILPAARPAFDGRSWMPLLRGQADGWPARSVMVDSQRVPDPIKWKQSSVMHGPWRLVNGRELYHLAADPGQARDIAAAHPEQVAALRADYETWWNELAPTFAQPTRVALGRVAGTPVVLTAHDWLRPDDRVPWHQGTIREGPEVNGRWAVRIVAPGRYEFRLRRWPPEVDVPLQAGLPPGAVAPGLRAYREEVGRALPINRARLQAGQQTLESPVGIQDRDVVFSLEMPAGEADLTTTFISPDGSERGAYYLVVQRVQ